MPSIIAEAARRKLRKMYKLRKTLNLLIKFTVQLCNKLLDNIKGEKVKHFSVILLLLKTARELTYKNKMCITFLS